MKGQNIRKYKQKELNLMIRKQEIILFLYHATKCPTEAEKIDFTKVSLLLTLQDKNETEYNRISFSYYNGYHLRKQRKIKANNSCKNKSENKKSRNLINMRRIITALRKKHESRKSKR